MLLFALGGQEWLVTIPVLILLIMNTNGTPLPLGKKPRNIETAAGCRGGPVSLSLRMRDDVRLQLRGGVGNSDVGFDSGAGRVSCLTADELRCALEKGGHVKARGVHKFTDGYPLVIQSTADLVLDGEGGMQIDGPVLMMPLDERIHRDEGRQQAGQRKICTVRGVEVLRRHENPRISRERGLTCVHVTGRGWDLEACGIKSEGGLCVKVAGRSVVSLSCCEVGGVGDGVQRAGVGVGVYDAATAVVRDCKVSACLMSLMACGGGEMEVVGCEVFHMSYGIAIDEKASVTASGCSFHRVKGGVVTVGSDAAESASLRMEGNDVQGLLWFGAYRPGEFVFDSSNRVSMATPRIEDRKASAAPTKTEAALEGPSPPEFMLSAEQIAERVEADDALSSTGGSNPAEGGCDEFHDD